MGEVDQPDRFLAGYRTCVCDLYQRLYRIGLAYPQDLLRQGAAVPGTQGRSLLSTLWDGSLDARGRARLQERHRGDSLRQVLPDVRWTGGCQGTGLDDGTVDSAEQRRACGQPRRRVLGRRTGR